MIRPYKVLSSLSVVFPLLSLMPALAQEATPLGEPVAPRDYELPDSRFAFDAAHASASDHATTSTTAARASFADQASFANRASLANRANLASRALSADTARYATRAGHANTADYAASAGEAEYSVSAGQADFSTRSGSADFADSAGFADFAEDSNAVATNVGIAPIGQRVTFSKSPTSDSSQTSTTYFDKPADANIALIDALCVTSGHQGYRATVTMAFNAGYTRTMTLCDSSDTADDDRENQYTETVQMEVPYGATRIAVTQTVHRKAGKDRKAYTRGGIQWFGPASLASNTPPPPPAPPSGGGGSGGTPGGNCQDDIILPPIGIGDYSDYACP